MRMISECGENRNERRTDVGEIETKEGDRPNVRVTSIGATTKGLAREERVLEILTKGAAKAVRNLHESSHEPRSQESRRKGTHLEDVEYHVQLDRLLSPHAVVHLARVRHAMEHKQGSDENERLGEVALVRKTEVPPSRAGEGVVPEVGEEVGEGGEGAEGEDGKGVEERVEADDEAEHDDLRVATAGISTLSFSRAVVRTFSTSPGTVRKLVTLSALTPSSPSISTASTSCLK